MKRKAPPTELKEAVVDEAGDSEPRRAPPRIDDYLIAEEILPRLPVRATAACAVAGSALRGILTDPNYWLARNRRLPAGPRAACLVVRGCYGGGVARFRHEFHYADASAAAEPPAVVRSVGESPEAFHYGGTCNGLVLLAAPWDNTGWARAVLFNPATAEEETVAVDLSAADGNGNIYRCFCGIGYSPATKAYKALVCATDFINSLPGEHCSSADLVVVPLGGGAAGGGRQEESRRTAATVANMCSSFQDFPSSISMDGKVYLLPTVDSPSEVEAFDVDSEAAAAIPLPESNGKASHLMEVWGRPCIAMCYLYERSELWVLTPEHRWELRCTLVAPTPCIWRWLPGLGGFKVRGTWDCGGGLLFALLRDGCGFMYDLAEMNTWRMTTREPELAAGKLPKEMEEGSFCWGYRPTLVPPAAAVFGDGGALAGKNPRPWCLEVLMEMMKKRPRMAAWGGGCCSGHAFAKCM